LSSGPCISFGGSTVEKMLSPGTSALLVVRVVAAIFPLTATARWRTGAFDPLSLPVT
jgi:hypothetical protein